MSFENEIIFCLALIGLAAFVTLRLESPWRRKIILLFMSCAIPVTAIWRLVKNSQVSDPFISGYIRTNELWILTILGIVFLGLLGMVSFKAPATSLPASDLKEVQSIGLEKGRPVLKKIMVDRFNRMTGAEDVAKTILLVLGMVFTMNQAFGLLRSMAEDHQANLLIFVQSHSQEHYRDATTRGDLVRQGDRVLVKRRNARGEEWSSMIVHDCADQETRMVGDGIEYPLNSTVVVNMDRALSCAWTDPARQDGEQAPS